MTSFNPDLIVEEFNSHELVDKDLIDFLPNIRPFATVYKTPLQEIDLLRKWQRFFTAKGIAWAVTKESQGVHKLWKEKRVEYGGD